ncbi:DUF6491 family protein [Phenylobacterium sp.]|jgi:hypothetical protein|uniref:DUF6491 family protein n=1 Tax=Phenylobacterium sp. TaxID=1871053 RepID=UPI002F95375D
MTTWIAPAGALAALALGAMTLAGCTAGARMSAEGAPQRTGGRQCFWASSVNGFRAVDDRTVNLRVGVRDIYQLDLIGPCPEVDWASQIGIQSRGGNSICTGLDAVLIAPTSIGPQRCHVRTVRRLTPPEVAALPDAARP